MHRQRYLKKSNKFFQEKQSAMRMDFNVRNSCTGNSRHIDIRYFFINDQLNKEGLSILYCPTQMMLAGYLSKPLQGEFFHKFENKFMGRFSLFKILEDTPTYTRK